MENSGVLVGGRGVRNLDVVDPSSSWRVVGSSCAHTHITTPLFPPLPPPPSCKVRTSIFTR